MQCFLNYNANSKAFVAYKKGGANLKGNKKIPSKESDEYQLKKLAEVLTQYDLTAAEIFEDGKKYRVEKNSDKDLPLTSVVDAPSNTEKDQTNTIFSTMVGVFHEAYSENEIPLVKVGQHFKAGDPLCVIEAMKTFTEVQADESGIVKEICAKNGDLIEYSQPLLKYIKQ